MNKKLIQPKRDECDEGWMLMVMLMMEDGRKGREKRRR